MAGRGGRRSRLGFDRISLGFVVLVDRQQPARGLMVRSDQGEAKTEIGLTAQIPGTRHKKKPQWAETPNRHLRSAQNGQQSSFFAGAGQRNQSSIARLVGCNGGDDVRDRSLGKGGGLRAGAASRFGPAAKKNPEKPALPLDRA